MRARKPKLQPVELLEQQLAEAGLEFLFEREVRFSPDYPTWRHVAKVEGRRHWHWEQTEKVRMWRFDLGNRAFRLAVEVQGGVYIQGAHSRGASQTGDWLKLVYAQLLNWVVIVVDPGMIKAGVALDLIRRALVLRESNGTTADIGMRSEFHAGAGSAAKVGAGREVGAGVAVAVR